MSGLLCVTCKLSAQYVYMGKSLCKIHFQEWVDHATGANNE